MLSVISTKPDLECPLPVKSDGPLEAPPSVKTVADGISPDLIHKGVVDRKIVQSSRPMT